MFSLALTIAACQNAPSGQDQAVEVLTVEAFDQKIKELGTAQLIDVRTPGEFESGHIEGAHNVDWMDDAAFDRGVAELDPEKPVLVYCQAGVRSADAAAALEKRGFKKVYDLKGGYGDWSATH